MQCWTRSATRGWGTSFQRGLQDSTEQAMNNLTQCWWQAPLGLEAGDKEPPPSFLSAEISGILWSCRSGVKKFQGFGRSSSWLRIHCCCLKCSASTSLSAYSTGQSQQTTGKPPHLPLGLFAKTNPSYTWSWTCIKGATDDEQAETRFSNITSFFKNKQKDNPQTFHWRNT